ncbi:LysE family translocator [Martelella mediterranea]|uniref:LysE family translocator n=1 Tax=uncultured Martelella sp. TaxID=392331 RepID=UPI000D07E7F5|nr:LysE family translocator [uncultured Martelella sp.]
MEIQTWFAFAGASIALLAIPGPVVMLLLGYTLGYGPRAAVAAVPGVILGDFTAMSLSLLGAGAILAASASLFLTLKLVGAVYLLWLGIKLWRDDAKPMTAVGRAPLKGWKAFGSAYWVTALNPKDIVFFVAFLPQFISPEQPLVPQIVIIEATFLSLVLFSNAVWILLGSKLSRYFGRRSHIRIANRVGAGWLVGAGLLTAVKG